MGAHTLGAHLDSQSISSGDNHYSCCHCEFHRDGTLYLYYGHLAALQANKEPEYSFISGKLLPSAVEGTCVCVCACVCV